MTRRILIYLIWLTLGFTIGYAVSCMTIDYWWAHCWK
jgi:hypothetical protein